jgi:hypothetical protein
MVIREAVRATPYITLKELCARVADTQGIRFNSCRHAARHTGTA